MGRRGRRTREESRAVRRLKNRELRADWGRAFLPPVDEVREPLSRCVRLKLLRQIAAVGHEVVEEVEISPGVVKGLLQIGELVLQDPKPEDKMFALPFENEQLFVGLGAVRGYP